MNNMDAMLQLRNQLREINRLGYLVRELRVSEKTVKKLTEGTPVCPNVKGVSPAFWGFPVVDEDRIPFGEMRAVTSHGIEAIFLNLC